MVNYTWVQSGEIYWINIGFFDLVQFICFFAKCAVFAGEHAGGVMWDIEKFFDTAEPGTLLMQGQVVKFLLNIMKLALPVHLAPRFLAIGNAVSPLISDMLKMRSWL